MRQISPDGPPREAIVARLFELFRRAGFEGVSISDVARATGLGKSSLYHHFPGGKADMAAAVLAHAEAWFEAEIIAPLRGDGARETRIDTMLAALDRLYDGGAKACLLASMLLGQSDNDIERAVRAALQGWIDAIAEALTSTGLAGDEARKRAVSAVIQIEGALLVARALNAPAAFRQTLDGVREMLLRPNAG